MPTLELGARDGKFSTKYYISLVGLNIHYKLILVSCIYFIVCSIEQNYISSEISKSTISVRTVHGCTFKSSPFFVGSIPTVLIVRG